MQRASFAAREVSRLPGRDNKYFVPPRYPFFGAPDQKRTFSIYSLFPGPRRRGARSDLEVAAAARGPAARPVSPRIGLRALSRLRLATTNSEKARRRPLASLHGSSDHDHERSKGRCLCWQHRDRVRLAGTWKYAVRLATVRPDR